MLRRLVTSKAFGSNLKLPRTVAIKLVLANAFLSCHPLCRHENEYSPKSHEAKYPDQKTDSLRAHVLDGTHIDRLTVIA